MRISIPALAHAGLLFVAFEALRCAQSAALGRATISQFKYPAAKVRVEILKYGVPALRERTISHN
jgi:hypothetical protein